MIININQMNNRLSSYLISLNTNQTTTYDVENLGPGLGRAQTCGGIKPVNGIPTLPSRKLNLPQQYVCNLCRNKR